MLLSGTSVFEAGSLRKRLDDLSHGLVSASLTPSGLELRSGVGDVEHHGRLLIKKRYTGTRQPNSHAEKHRTGRDIVVGAWTISTPCCTLTIPAISGPDDEPHTSRLSRNGAGGTGGGDGVLEGELILPRLSKSNVGRR